MNFKPVLKVLERYAPMVIMTVFTIIGGLGDIQAEDELEKLKADVEELKKR